MLTPEERDQLDAYHARVLTVVGPKVPGDVAAWLAEACAAL
jgi:Xaa-Pro aminopeptidase